MRQLQRLSLRQARGGNGKHHCMAILMESGIHCLEPSVLVLLSLDREKMSVVD